MPTYIIECEHVMADYAETKVVFADNEAQAVEYLEHEGFIIINTIEEQEGA